MQEAISILGCALFTAYGLGLGIYFEAVCSSQWGSLYELKLVKPCTLLLRRH